MVTTILWPAIVASILPLGLRALLNRLPALAALAQRLAKLTGAFPRQIEAHRHRYHMRPEILAPQSY
jgi:hypothetical protein